MLRFEVTNVKPEANKKPIKISTKIKINVLVDLKVRDRERENLEICELELMKSYKFSRIDSEKKNYMMQSITVPLLLSMAQKGEKNL